MGEVPPAGVDTLGKTTTQESTSYGMSDKF